MGISTRSDPAQILKAVTDYSSESIKVQLAATTAIELSAADGDSVYATPNSTSDTATVPNGTVTGTVVVGPVDITSISRLNLVSNTTSAITATGLTLTVECSPSDSDDVWFATALTITVTTTANAVDVGTVLQNLVFRRARVKVSHSAYTVGSLKCYLLGRS